MANSTNGTNNRRGMANSTTFRNKCRANSENGTDKRRVMVTGSKLNKMAG